MAGWNLTGTVSDNGAAGAGGDAISVSQAMEMAAGALDAIPQLTMVGEVTGFRGPNARSGHCYFQVKDDSAAVDCIIWRGSYMKRAFDLRDGMQLNLTGSFNLYKPTGRMSFVARSFTLAGEGLLRQQVAELAEKLRREGLMEPARRRRIPVFCTRVAVVTSLSGAVIDDVKRTLRRRNPLVEIVCVGSKVQGEGAPAELIEGLARAAALDPAPDCILLVRGGGSFEDLMTFNDESLARAVAACPVPVVTGIGHEPDTSICDMVGDRRCSTPTAAAESVAPAMADLVEVLGTREQRLRRTVDARVSEADLELDRAAGRAARAWSERSARWRLELDALAARPVLARPGAALERRAMELDQTSERLAAAGPRSAAALASTLAREAPRLASAARVGLAARRHAEGLAAQRLSAAGGRVVAGPAAALAEGAAKLDALSPLKVLSRGYAIAYAGGAAASTASAFAPGDELRVRLADGEVAARVTSVSMRRE